MKAKTPPVVQDSSTKKKKIAEKKTPTKKVASAKPPGKLPRVKPAKKAIKQGKANMPPQIPRELKEYIDLIDSFNLVKQLVGENADYQNADEQKANEWLIKNRETLTTDKLRLIVHAAMIHQETAMIYKRTKAKQEKAHKKDETIFRRYLELSAEGHGKNAAATIIAKEVNLKFDTVRDKLQGDFQGKLQGK